MKSRLIIFCGFFVALLRPISAEQLPIKIYELQHRERLANCRGPLDLNRDRVPEYELRLTSGGACGMVNCSIYLYRQSAGGYEMILDEASGYGLDVLKTSTNGYADVLVRPQRRVTARSRGANRR